MKRRFLSVVLAGVMTFAALGLTGCGSGGGDAITFWIPKGEDTAYLAEYEDHPVLQYIEENYEFNGKNISFDFFTAPPGGEADDFSTLIGTGDYCDIMDMSMASITAAEMYEEDMIWDLTELVPEHMPNYMKFLEENPDCEKNMYWVIDGEKKILTLTGFSDEPTPMFQGFCYRRDWVAKYGKNPVTGQAFTYGFTDENDKESWQDDVVFPSGGSDPMYISDWEWMFDIFQTAMKEQGIEDGYCYAPYYLGYMQTGDLATGFGGGGPYTYIEDGTAYDGMISDNFRAYLQCLNHWWNEGYLDQHFGEHTQDMFYSVDSDSVFQGKVGLWQGRISTVGTQIDAGDAYTSGAVVYGARQPINDIYGGEAQKNKEPDMMYQNSKTGSGVVLTKKLDEEEVIAVLEFVDFLYTEEGYMLANFGLNQEQYESFEPELYKELGLTEGNYTIDEEGVIHTVFDTNNDKYSLPTLTRFTPRLTVNKNVDRGYDVYAQHATDEWAAYENVLGLQNDTQNAVSADAHKQMTKIGANLDPFYQKAIGPMIQGTGNYDINDDASWAQYVKDAKKFGSDKVTALFQDAVDIVKSAK